jgi:hypothetical protein
MTCLTYFPCIFGGLRIATKNLDCRSQEYLIRKECYSLDLIVWFIGNITVHFEKAAIFLVGKTKLNSIV